MTRKLFHSSSGRQAAAVVAAICVVLAAPGENHDPWRHSGSEVDARNCGLEGGCLRGWCWTGCDSTLGENEWCYTTRGYSQDFKYVRCASDSDCDKCWKCAGACTFLSA